MMKKRVKNPLGVIVLFFLVLSGCEKKEPPQTGNTDVEASVAVAAVAEADESEAAPGPGTIQIERRESTDKDAGKQPVAEIDRNTGLEGFLALGRGKLVLPEDFIIGELQSHRTTEADEAELLVLLHDFFDNLSKGVFKESLVLEEWRASLRDTMTYTVEKDLVPEKMRIGAFRFAGDGEARCNIRIYQGKGVTSGEVYFRKILTTWFISDLQIDFALLAGEYTGSPEPYEPGIYKYLETF